MCVCEYTLLEGINTISDKLPLILADCKTKNTHKCITDKLQTREIPLKHKIQNALHMVCYCMWACACVFVCVCTVCFAE